ncbi:hypothetical protein KGF57_002005 [Candida theae]|uniref:Uncharacterized protein n=1 Tax=Candida theae TaxID=1198502 RepID=A0AAD5BGJ5_9ASCO|nr:uncharacterized protein KGF57_002005 [Candida theae]KAI5960005.1 hypothetical protein KGF57_002005 [Candida theae]
MSFEQIIKEEIDLVYSNIDHPYELDDTAWKPYVLIIAKKYARIFRFLHTMTNKHLTEKHLQKMFKTDLPVDRDKAVETFSTYLLNHFNNVSNLRIVDVMAQGGEKITLLQFYQRILSIEPAYTKRRIEESLEEVSKGIPNRHAIQDAMFDAVHGRMRKDGTAIFVDHLPVYVLRLHKYLKFEHFERVEKLLDLLYKEYILFITIDNYHFPGINRLCREIGIRPNYLEEHRGFNNEDVSFVSEFVEITAWNYKHPGSKE